MAQEQVLVTKLSSILCSIQTLTQTSTQQENYSKPSKSLIQLLNFNLKACRDLSKSLSRRSDAPNSTFTSKLTTDSDSLPVYLDFTEECLSLLSLLDETLIDLFKKDRDNTAKERPLLPAPVPKPILSVSELKSIHGLLQFTISLGIYPFLSPKIDKMLQLKLSNARSLEKFNQLPDKVKSFLLYKSLSVLIHLLGNPVLGAIVSSKHLSDILAALIHICYAPKNTCDYSVETMSVTTMASPSDIGHKNPCHEEEKNEISAIQHEWCVEALQRIVRQSYQPLVIKELLALQSLSSPDGKKKSGKLCNDNWVRRPCGQLLSERLMDKDGVQNVLKAIYDSTGEDNWKKCQAVAMVIATCPAQALSVDHYYSLVCPQVLHLLTSAQEGISGQFVKVGMATLSVMLTKQGALARKYLVKPLLEPLSCAGSAVSGGSFVSSIDDLYKVTSTTEPSSPLLAELFSYCPLLFLAWIAGNGHKERKTSFQSREILCRVLRNASNSKVLGFFCFMCGFQTETHHTLFKQHYNMNILFQYLSVDSSETLKIETLTDAEVLESKNVEEMEKVGSGLVALLNVELREVKIVGRFFVACLEYLTAIILQQTNNTSCAGVKECAPKTVSSDQSNDLHTLPRTNSALLDCEVVLPPSHTESYYSSLVLFVTASICEDLSSTLLQEVSLPDLLASITSLVLCHASYCKDRDIKDCLKVLANEDIEILGGPITLSIVFGLLSAVLSGAVEVNREHRSLLAELQPSLEVISNNYPDEELCSLASELNICIATLGAVWSSEVKQRADVQVYRARKALKESMSESAQHESTKSQTMDDTKCLPVSEAMYEENSTNYETSDANYKMSNTTYLPSPYQMAMQDTNDPLIPLKGHGIIALTKLIDKRDQEALANLHNLLSLFVKFLHNSDSYVYLAAIKGLVSLSAVPSARDSVISFLCQEYAQFSGPSVSSQDTARKLETSQLTMSTQDAKLCKMSNLGKLDVHVRIKIGEALLKIFQLCRAFLPHYLDQVTAAIFSNTKDPDPLIRASSLSNLADICGKLTFSKIQVEVLSCVSNVLQTEREVEVRQAALIVLKLSIRSLTKDEVEVMSERLLDVYRLLKSVESSEKDELARTHAQAALGELDTVMRSYIFPTNSRTLTKKISVLDIVQQ